MTWVASQVMPSWFHNKPYTLANMKFIRQTTPNTCSTRHIGSVWNASMRQQRPWVNLGITPHSTIDLWIPFALFLLLGMSHLWVINLCQETINTCLAVHVKFWDILATCNQWLGHWDICQDFVLSRILSFISTPSQSWHLEEHSHMQFLSSISIWFYLVWYFHPLGLIYLKIWP